MSFPRSLTKRTDICLERFIRNILPNMLQIVETVSDTLVKAFAQDGYLPYPQIATEIKIKRMKNASSEKTIM